MDKKQTNNRWSRTIICFIAAAGIIASNGILYSLVFKRPRQRWMKDTYDCAVVCGYPANDDGGPSDIMKKRVERAADLFRKEKVKYLIFSGAAVYNQYTEADVMREYARSLGIPDECMLMENRAVSTYHNMMYAKEIMEMNGINDCVVVTNGWHLRKADHYARKFHLDYIMCKADNPACEHVRKTIWRYIETGMNTYINIFRGYK